MIIPSPLQRERIMDAALLLQRNVLSLELETFGLRQIVGNGVAGLQNYLHNMKEFMHELVTPMRNDAEKNLVGFVQDRDANKLVDHTNYMSLKDIDVFVPAGLSVTYSDHIDALEKSQAAIAGIIVKTIAPAIAYFGVLLGSPETLSSSSRQSQEDTIKFNTKEIALVKKEIASCYGNDMNQSRRPFGKVFTRNREWEDCTKRLETLTVQLAELSPRAVSEKVDELVGMLDRLIIRMEQSPEVYKVNGVTGAAMARIVMGIGEEVEYYASHVHLVQVASQVMKDNGDRLKEILNRQS